MTLSRKDVDHIAHLARLAVSEAEAEDSVAKLSRILALADELQRVDTQGVEPMAHPLEMTQRLRADEVAGAVERDLWQGNAAQAAEGLYLVPRVIE